MLTHNVYHYVGAGCQTGKIESWTDRDFRSNRIHLNEHALTRRVDYQEPPVQTGPLDLFLI